MWSVRLDDLCAAAPNAVVADCASVAWPEPPSRVLGDAVVRDLDVRSFEHLSELSRSRGIALEACVSLHGHAMVRRAKQSAQMLRQKAPSFVSRYQRGESVVSMARRSGVSPVMLVRQIVSAVMKCEPQKVGQLLKNAAALPTGLREQVIDCFRADAVYSPFVELLKDHVGVEWEYYLVRKLSLAGLQFRTEDDMRAEGFAKTPDVFFQIPHVVELASGERVVALWMDSKATFGEKFTLQQGLRDQLMAYRMRFGPGVVVFWFGHGDECDCKLLTSHGIAVTDYIRSVVPAD